MGARHWRAHGRGDRAGTVRPLGAVRRPQPGAQAARHQGPRTERRPWMYPEPVYQACKDAYHWRYSLCRTFIAWHAWRRTRAFRCAAHVLCLSRGGGCLRARFPVFLRRPDDRGPDCLPGRPGQRAGGDGRVGAGRRMGGLYHQGSLHRPGLGPRSRRPEPHADVNEGRGDPAPGG